MDIKFLDITGNNFNAAQITSNNNNDDAMITETVFEQTSTAVNSNDSSNFSDSEIELINDAFYNDSDIETDDLDENIQVSSVSSVLNSDELDIQNNQTTNSQSNYINKDDPHYQIKQWTIDLLKNGLYASDENYNEQLNEQGAVREAYSYVKDLIDIGVGKDDINQALTKQEELIEQLTTALNDGSFEEKFKELTGVEFDEEKMIQYQEASNNYSFASILYQKANVFQNEVLSAQNMNEVYNSFLNYYGSEDTALSKLNEYLKETYDNANFQTDTRRITGVNIGVNKDTGEKEITLTYTYPDLSYDKELGYEIWQDATDTETLLMNDAPNYLNYSDTTGVAIGDKNKFTQEANGKINELFNSNLEELGNTYAQIKHEAIGDADQLEQLVTQYCNSQNDFIDKLATGVQFAGLITTTVGGVVTFVNPPTGIAIMGIGNKMALAGMFGDNALELADQITSKNGLTQDEFINITKESALEITTLLVGANINKIAECAQQGTFALSQTLGLSKQASTWLSWMSEAGVDASLSILTDVAMTGDLNLSGNSLQVLLGILTGVANAKYNSYKANVLDELVSKLESKTMTSSEITDFLKKANLSENDIIGYRTYGEIIALEKNGFDLSNYKGYDQNSTQGKAVLSDIDLLYKAYTTGTDVKDLMVPATKSIETGLKNSAVGDLFEVDEKMYIKNKQGNATELGMSKEKYCQLFPVLDRYSSGQQYSGDCYIVSTLNSLIADPSTREKILSCFSEDSNGDITVKLPKSETTITLKPEQNIESFVFDPRYTMTGAPGLQALEYLYKVTAADSEIKRLTAKMDAGFKCASLSFDIASDICEEYGISLDNIDLNKLEEAQKLVAERIAASDAPVLSIDDGDALLSLLDSNPELAYLNYFIQACEYYIDAQEISKTLSDLSNEDTSFVAEVFGGNGGTPAYVLDAFGFKNSEIIKDLSNVENIIKNNDKIYLAGTIDPMTTEGAKIGLVEKHAYSFEKRINANGEIEIIVTNPWALSGDGMKENKEIVLTIEQFKKFFNQICMADK